MTGPSVRPKVAVAVCTHYRNEPLRSLLHAVLANAAHLGERAAVGVVVVDDSTDGSARSVVEQFEGRFELGITYRLSGRQNISIARNTGLETAIELADWTAMTDDDCEPVPEWLEELIRVQQSTGADSVTGPLVRRMPPGSPAWLTEEPFLEIAVGRGEDGVPVNVGATHNSIISNRWLKENPGIRFDPMLGVDGGEDVVFYRAACRAGLKAYFARHAVVYENEPPSRATLRYQLRLFFWLGNRSYVTSVRSGASSLRLFFHGAKSFLKAVVRPIAQVLSGQRPQLRYCLALVFRAVGVMVAPLGIQLRHR